MDLYAQDSNPNKFDLGVGVYKDDQGLTPIPHSVKRAEQRLVDTQTTKTYIGGHGNAAFGTLISELVLGTDSALLREGRAGATQTPGGTGALRLSADFIAHSLPGRGVWLSNPTWPIHETIFAKAGLKGFGDGLEQDAWAVRLMATELPEVLVTSSCSKNFGLYSDRVGALIVCAADAEKLTDVRSQLANIARNLWSTPPDHGAAVVATILGDAELKTLWSGEVEAMRSRIAQLRCGLVEALAPHGLSERFAHIGAQRGMFSYTGLSAEQVKQLREKHSVYMVSSGRANVAGIDATRLTLLAEAIADVSN
ncbi:hypothetical protein L1887_53136 [Cichorium endivia]|nr:hypothetical protein L1887_53136 [Cichorium endivia]